MTRSIRIDIACNDADNGCFSGKCCGIQISHRGVLVEIEAESWGGYIFRWYDGKIRLHRKSYVLTASKYGVGNWCWNGFYFAPLEAKRFIRDIAASGHWRCTNGPTVFYDWFNARSELKAAA